MLSRVKAWLRAPLVLDRPGRHPNAISTGTIRRVLRLDTHVGAKMVMLGLLIASKRYKLPVRVEQVAGFVPSYALRTAVVYLRELSKLGAVERTMRKSRTEHFRYRPTI